MEMSGPELLECVWSRQQTDPVPGARVVVYSKLYSTVRQYMHHHLDIVRGDAHQYVRLTIEYLCQLRNGYPARFVHACGMQMCWPRQQDAFVCGTNQPGGGWCLRIYVIALLSSTRYDASSLVRQRVGWMCMPGVAPNTRCAHRALSASISKLRVTHH